MMLFWWYVLKVIVLNYFEIEECDMIYVLYLKLIIEDEFYSIIDNVIEIGLRICWMNGKY